MTTVKAHLIKVHAANAEHHVAMAKIHKRLAKAHGAEENEAHAEIAEAHSDAAQAHTAAAEENLTCCKELGGASDDSGTTKTVDAGTVAVQQITIAELQELRENLHKATALLGDRLVPDSIRGVIPSNPNRPGVVAVPRVGQPQELVNKSNTPTEFEHLLAID